MRASFESIRRKRIGSLREWVARPARALVSVSRRNELSFCSVKTVDMRALVGIVAIMLTASVALAADDCFSLSPTRLDDYPAVHREKAKTYQ